MIKDFLKKTTKTNNRMVIRLSFLVVVVFSLLSCQKQNKTQYPDDLHVLKTDTDSGKKYISKRSKYKHFAVILSGPSGVGKTTVINKFLEKYKKQIEISISATTRLRRNGEQDGKDYYFITKEQFVKLVQDGEFLEHVFNFGNYYGTPKRNYIDAVMNDRDIIFTLDVKGMERAKQSKKIDFVTIFMMPPSMEDLKERLQGRGTETEAQVSQRFASAKKEIQSALGKYDYVIYNANFDETVKKLEAIYLAEQRKREYVEVDG